MLETIAYLNYKKIDKRPSLDPFGIIREVLIVLLP